MDWPNWIGGVVASIEIAFLYAIFPVLFIWACVGAIVILTHIRNSPPPAPAPGDRCAACTQAQAVWDDMSDLERWASLAYFTVAKVACLISGCNLNLRPIIPSP